MNAVFHVQNSAGMQFFANFFLSIRELFWQMEKKINQVSWSVEIFYVFRERFDLVQW